MRKITIENLDLQSSSVMSIIIVTAIPFLFFRLFPVFLSVAHLSITRILLVRTHIQYKLQER